MLSYSSATRKQASSSIAPVCVEVTVNTATDDMALLWFRRLKLKKWNPIGTLPSKAPFRYENFWLLATVALLFVFKKNYPIMDYLSLKDSSR